MDLTFLKIIAIQLFLLEISMGCIWGIKNYLKEQENLKEGIKLTKKYYETEASGNINLKTVKSVAATGVNRISVGSITHSAPAIDFKLEI